MKENNDISFDIRQQLKEVGKEEKQIDVMGMEVDRKKIKNGHQLEHR